YILTYTDFYTITNTKKRLYTIPKWFTTIENLLSINEHRMLLPMNSFNHNHCYGYIIRLLKHKIGTYNYVVRWDTATKSFITGHPTYLDDNTVHIKHCLPLVGSRHYTVFKDYDHCSLY
ncbi:7511_t:CDS:1, partial [Funneliformis caledonium]